MTTTNTLQADDIINRVAAEVGLTPTLNAYGTSDPAFVKLRYLLQIAGEELALAHPWEFLTKSHAITTAVDDTGVYPLPDDFLYMIPQTGWEHSQNVALGGPLSAQEWTYLQGRDLASTSIYASFRISDGSFNVYPNPPPEGLDIRFEYVNRNWVRSPTQPYTYGDTLDTAAHTPMYDRTLITRYLKLKYLQATGFDTTAAEDDFAQNFDFITGKDKGGGGIVNAGRTRIAYPYLSHANIPDTGFGGV